MNAYQKQRILALLNEIKILKQHVNAKGETIFPLTIAARQRTINEITKVKKQ